MAPDDTDTIVAPASARGAGDRAVVRIAGPIAIAIAEQLASRSLACDSARRFSGLTLDVEVDAAPRQLHASVLVWPDARSYTRQPAVEVHTVGSPPLIDAVVRACLAAGARLAEPGEFTLRACLAGRIDLLQAEAVLAVIDARHEQTLQAALAQMAGGLSTPLQALRADLLGLLADLEAGLDFVDEEDVKFVEQEELCRRLASAFASLAQVQSQMSARRATDGRPRVALVGPPNVGKSRLYNTLVERFGVDPHARPALVADQPGVTRDEVLAVLRVGTQEFELVDTPGVGEAAIDRIDAAAQERSRANRQSVDLQLVCEVAAKRGCYVAQSAPLAPGESPGASRESPESNTPPESVRVATMADRASDVAMPPGVIRTSAVTGEGVATLAEAIARRLEEAAQETTASGVVASTAQRAGESIATARAALAAAQEAAALGAGDELVSFELRRALDGLGRVTGEVVTDDVLDQIFGKFCIGK